MPSFSRATAEMRCSFAACAISISDIIPPVYARGSRALLLVTGAFQIRVDEIGRGLRTPLHAAGELARILVAKVLQADLREQELREREVLLRQLAAGARPVENVVPCRHPGEQCRFLEHDEPIAIGSGDRSAVEQD